MRFFRGANEKNLAVGGIGYRIKLLELQDMAFDRLAADRLLEIVTENVFSQHANGHGRGLIGKGLGGPVHKPGKIIDKSRLNLVFGRLRVAFEPDGEDQTETQNYDF